VLLHPPQLIVSISAILLKLEYLGLGYDLIRGNPRGTDSSELDTGFRYRVIRLRQEGNFTVDGQFKVPLGVETKVCNTTIVA